MKIRLEDIVSNVSNIQELQELELPTKVSYRLKRLVDKLTPILKTYGENRTKLFEKFGEKNEKGEWEIKNDSPKIKDFTKEHKELLEIEEEIEFEKISVETLGAIKVKPRLLVEFIFTE